LESKNQQSLPDKIISAINLIDENPTANIREELIHLINELINKDFYALIQLLYRIDVNEKKIRLYLNENSVNDSAPVLADLIIERQIEKIESRKKFTQKNKIEDDEKW
jgi:hypothetical protein